MNSIVVSEIYDLSTDITSLCLAMIWTNFRRVKYIMRWLFYPLITLRLFGLLTAIEYLYYRTRGTFQNTKTEQCNSEKLVWAQIVQQLLCLVDIEARGRPTIMSAKLNNTFSKTIPHQSILRTYEWYVIVCTRGNVLLSHYRTVGLVYLSDNAH